MPPASPACPADPPSLPALGGYGRWFAARHCPASTHTLPAPSLLFCPTLGLPPIWEDGRSRLPLSWALGPRSRAQVKGLPGSGDSRDAIILAAQPAVPSWGPGSTWWPSCVSTAVLLHLSPIHPLQPLLMLTVPSIPSTSVLMPNATSDLQGVLGWGRRGARPAEYKQGTG